MDVEDLLRDPDDPKRISNEAFARAQAELKGEGWRREARDRHGRWTSGGGERGRALPGGGRLLTPADMTHEQRQAFGRLRTIAGERGTDPGGEGAHGHGSYGEFATARDVAWLSVARGRLMTNSYRPPTGNKGRDRLERLHASGLVHKNPDGSYGLTHRGHMAIENHRQHTTPR